MSRGNRLNENYHKPHTVDDVTENNVQTIMRLEEAAKADRDLGDRTAEWVANFCGRFSFVWVHLIWFCAWLIINSVPGLPHFDPYPFTFLTLVVSLEAIFLSTFILISQNQEKRLSERRNQLDLQVNLLTEQENTKMLQVLERIAKQLGVATDDDPSLRVLEQATRPDRLVNQIDQATRRSAD
jgi:uncharacterized membrane protein